MWHKDSVKNSPEDLIRGGSSKWHDKDDKIYVDPMALLRISLKRNIVPLSGNVLLSRKGLGPAQATPPDSREVDRPLVNRFYQLSNRR